MYVPNVAVSSNGRHKVRVLILTPRALRGAAVVSIATCDVDLFDAVVEVIMVCQQKRRGTQVCWRHASILYPGWLAVVSAILDIILLICLLSVEFKKSVICGGRWEGGGMLTSLCLHCVTF